MHVHVGVHPMVGSVAASPAAGGQKAKAAAWFLSVLSPHTAKPSLQSSLVGDGSTGLP